MLNRTLNLKRYFDSQIYYQMSTSRPYKTSIFTPLPKALRDFYDIFLHPSSPFYEKKLYRTKNTLIFSTYRRNREHIKRETAECWIKRFLPSLLLCIGQTLDLRL